MPEPLEVPERWAVEARLPQSRDHVEVVLLVEVGPARREPPRELDCPGVAQVTRDAREERAVDRRVEHGRERALVVTAEHYPRLQVDRYGLRRAAVGRTLDDPEVSKEGFAPGAVPLVEGLGGRRPVRVGALDHGDDTAASERAHDHRSGSGEPPLDGARGGPGGEAVVVQGQRIAHAERTPGPERTSTSPCSSRRPGTFDAEHARPREDHDAARRRSQTERLPGVVTKIRARQVERNDLAAEREVGPLEASASRAPAPT